MIYNIHEERYIKNLDVSPTAYLQTSIDLMVLPLLAEAHNTDFEPVEGKKMLVVCGLLPGLAYGIFTLYTT